MCVKFHNFTTCFQITRRVVFHKIQGTWDGCEISRFHNDFSDYQRVVFHEIQETWESGEFSRFHNLFSDFT